jgi:hypothetical protein
MALIAWAFSGNFAEILRWSQTVIDLADGDPARGASFGIGSPLAAALAWRGVVRWWLGRPGWRQDHLDAIAMARSCEPTIFACVVAWTYGLEIQFGVHRADETAVRASEDATQAAEGTANDTALSMARYTLGIALLNADDATDRRRGLERMAQARDIWSGRVPVLVPVTDVWAARERGRRGDLDAAIAVIRPAVMELREAGPLGLYAFWGTGVLVETLLERGTDSDVSEAEEAIDWLAGLDIDEASAIHEITLLRLRAWLARVNGDQTYQDLVIRYHDMAKDLGYEGHIAWAEAMIQGGIR